MDSGVSTTGFPGRLEPRTENELVSGWKSPEPDPLVSICCATYNHVEWIEDALCGFLAQETDFPFEIIVRDDASTDGTAELVREYAARYPSIVRAVINDENRFGSGERASHVWPKLAKGKYIALCEGDDFWISPTKLRQQVDLLEQHPEAVMSVALAHIFQQDGDNKTLLRTTQATAETLLGFEDIHKNYFHTSTYLVRADIFSQVIEKHFAGHVTFGDSALRAILVSIGPFALLPDVVSVYRITGQGIWSSLDSAAQLKWEYQAARKLSGILPGEHGRLQKGKLYGLAKQLFRVHLREASPVRAAFWAGTTLWHGAFKAPGYLARKVLPSLGDKAR